MARDTVIGTLLDDTLEARAALTEERAREMLTSADDAASLIVDHEFSELEQALLGDRDFRPALKLIWTQISSWVSLFYADGNPVTCNASGAQVGTDRTEMAHMAEGCWRASEEESFGPSQQSLRIEPLG